MVDISKIARVCISQWRLNRTITFRADNEIRLRRRFWGCQTPALIQLWMMSSIHYKMIKSLPPPPPVPQQHHRYEPDIHHGTGSAFLDHKVSAGRVRTPTQLAAQQTGAWWVKTQRLARQTQWSCSFWSLKAKIDTKKGPKQIIRQQY